MTAKQESEMVSSSYSTKQPGLAASDEIGSLFQADTLFAEKFFNNRRGKMLAVPEKRLMVAILEDALHCFQENCSAKRGKRKHLCDDAQKWFFEASGGWVFGFASICSVLGFDAEYVRKGLVRWREKELSKRRRVPLWQSTKTTRAQLSVHKQ